MRPWQKRFIRDVYEPHGLDNRRRVRRAILSIARKNGKTALIAALVLVHLVGPEAIANGEIYSAANDREQAAQVFKVAAQIVRADPELAALCRVVDSTKHISCYSNGSFYKAVSAEAGTKHGLNPSLVIFDELAQARNRELYDVLDTSMGARAEPLFITISTQSNDPEHILSKLIDDGLAGADPTIVCHLYAVPEETPVEELFTEKAWKLANPALGDFRSLEDLRTLAAKAQRMPAEEPKFRNLYLNQRVAPVSSLISRVEWTACAGAAEIEDGAEVYLALDMSAILDLTALAMGTAGERTRVRATFWKPDDLLREHSRRDFGSGHLRYEEWAKAGHILRSPGRSIDPAAVALHIAGLVQRFRVLGLAYDRWRIDTLRREFDRIGLATYLDGEKGDGLRLIPWGQGFKDMAPAIDALEQAVIERKLEHPANPVLTWNMANAVAVTDPAGNRKIDKDKARFRIDGAVALAMLMGLKSRDRKDEPVNLDDFLSNAVFV
ncbi:MULTISPECIES: terminase large subunit [Methylobacterium]|uniref:terminase large subunit n=1 Tax=Methylobacterium TaxID=407 RepID=UPI001FD99A61|nr:terminase TerL endonuclease subunit [Methylobacterium sp. PvP109]MCX7335747.1 terminase large subunit [Hyphomicrobiales bacterium]